MITIKRKTEPRKKGQLMPDRELKKILTMINSKVKSGVIVTHEDLEWQVLATGEMCYKLCPSLTKNEKTPIYFYWM
jgi:hypothetical protein